MKRRVLFALLAVTWIVQTAPATALDGTTFSITEVDFAASTITVTNHGDSDVDPNGLIVCNFPDYAPIAGAPMLGPGESTVVDIAAISIPANADDGELGLYLDSNFESSASIVAYVEWGSSGHTRSTVGIGAGVWSEGAVDPSGADGIAASSDTPTSAADWAPIVAQLPETGLSSSSVLVVALLLVIGGMGLVALARRQSSMTELVTIGGPNPR